MKKATLTKSQSKFFTSTARHTAFVGGYGSGKSFVGTLKAIVKLYEINKGNAGRPIPVGYYLPTYGLIEDVAMVYISEFLDKMNIKHQINKSSKKISLSVGDIILRSMDNPSMIVGYETGYAVIDEADVLPLKKMKVAFKNIIARNRRKLPNGEPNRTDFVSTPEGFSFLYDFFVKNASKNKVLIKGKTKENKHLPDGYIETLKDTYTETQLEAYLNGEFVNLSSGNVYYVFDREIHHSPREIKEHDILHIGMDFNITNMSAVVRVLDGNVSTAVEEITGAYDTAEMIRIIKERFANHRIVIYPDASSNARNTAGVSDMQLLKEARFIVRSNKSNPRVRDRVSTVNNSFEKMVSFVNTNNCPSLTEAYEQLGYKNGEPDKTTGFDHITDADGYVVHSLHFKSRPRAGVMGTGGNRL